MGLQKVTLTMHRGFISGNIFGRIVYWPCMLTMASLLMSIICVGMIGVMQVCCLHVHLGFVFDSELRQK